MMQTFLNINIQMFQCREGRGLLLPHPSLTSSFSILHITIFLNNNINKFDTHIGIYSAA